MVAQRLAILTAMKKSKRTPPKTPAAAAADERARTQQSATTATKDFLILSKPFLHEGVLLSSTKTGRRLYIHHLSELPAKEAFTTRIGNPIQRVDEKSVKLAGTITLEVGAAPPAAVPTMQVTAALPTSLFTGPVDARDEKVLQLLAKGKEANSKQNYAMACACFETAYGAHAHARQRPRLCSCPRPYPRPRPCP